MLEAVEVTLSHLARDRQIITLVSEATHLAIQSKIIMILHTTLQQ